MTQSIENNNCYDKLIWLSYHTGLLEKSQRLAMEQHLTDCDACMDIYLSVVEEHVPKDDSLLSIDFTVKLMQKVEREFIWQNAKVSYPNKPQNKAPSFINSKAALMISYCAAASIAMFFLTGGYFNGLADKVIQGVEHIPSKGIIELEPEQSRGLIQTGWTHKVLDEKRQPLFENFKINK